MESILRSSSSSLVRGVCFSASGLFWCYLALAAGCARPVQPPQASASGAKSASRAAASTPAGEPRPAAVEPEAAADYLSDAYPPAPTEAPAFVQTPPPG